ncbi:MAG TPA: hypothetical protein G4O19_00640 [Dehalococcoidia bacterium]|nr:hypothetical protein [Dehalococcoidia bacterium]
MADSKEVIISAIDNHINKNGGNYKGWYVGVSSDARCRLFNDHKVSEENGAWIYRTANSSDTAREVETFFINVRGTDGGTGGGDKTSDMVYTYKKTAYTKP